MKTKLFALLLSMVLCVLCLGSCKIFGPNGSTDTDPEGFIYDGDSELVIVYADDGIPTDVKNSLYNAITEARGTAPEFGGANLNKANHEIVLGRSDREVSISAYTKLEQLDAEGGENKRYVIYSDGSSVAIAYDEDDGYVTAARAVEVFIEKYAKSALTLAKGPAVADGESIYDLWAARDKTIQDAKWKAMADYIGGEQGQAVVDAFKVLYSNYDEGIVEWIANMFVPRECVCEKYDANGNKVCQYPVDAEGNYLCSGGGFYYSYSALENEGFLPDIESTEQALSMIASSGMAAQVGGTYANAIPAWMKNQIIAFIQPMQDPDSGYFWHPQWGSDVGTSRRSRDVNNAASVLLALGSRPLYDTPAGVEGSVDDYDSVSYGFSTERLGVSTVSAVSKVISTSSIVESSPWLESDVTFRAYLNGDYGNDMDLSTNSYQIGNTMTSQTKIIKKRDAELAAEGKTYSLMDILIEWFNAGQSPETGHWHTETDYYAMNGVLKILGVYASAGVAVNYAEQLAESIIDIIVCDEAPDGVVRIYNAWGSMAKLVSNIHDYAPAIDPVTGMTPDERLAALMDKMYEIAPEGIRITSERLAVFRKPDGGFSYKPDYSSPTSQGESVAVPNSPESDMNATMLATTGLVNHILSSLRLSSKRVPIFGEADRLRFLDIVEEASPVMKQPIDLGTPSAKTFDEDVLGERPASFSNITMQSAKGELFVADDPREGSDGNVAYFNSPNDKAELGGNGKPDYFYIRSSGSGSASNCFVFESDLCFISEKCADGKVVRLNMDDTYCITFSIVGDKVHLWECSNTSDSASRNVELAIISLDQWFNLKIEYYTGDEDTVRIKVYIDGALIAVSDNYYDADKTKITTGHGTPKLTYTRTKIEAISSAAVAMYFDNVNSYKMSKVYESTNDDSLVVNVDSPEKNEQKYDFADGYGDITLLGDSEVKGGTLNVYGGSEASGFTVPINLRAASGNAVTLSMDIRVTDDIVGEIGVLRFIEDNSAGGASLEFVLRIKETDGGKVIVVDAKSSTATVELDGIELSIGASVNLAFKYFRAEGVTLVYLDGERILSTDAAYSAAPRHTIGKLEFTNSGKNGPDISIDNLVFERSNVNFGKATEAARPSVSHDFESGLSDGAQSSGTIVTEDGNSSLKLLLGETLLLPINIRDDYAPVAIFEASLSLTLGADGVTHRITMLSADGGDMIVIDLKLAGNTITVRENLDGRTLGAVLGEASLEDEFVLRVEYFTLYGRYHLYINDQLVAVSDSITNSADGAIPSDIHIEALLVSELYVDDVIFEAWDKLYDDAKPEGVNPESGAEELTFESSTLGSIPSAVTKSLRSLGADVRVCQMLDKDGEYTTALKYLSNPGGIDAVLFGLTKKSDATAVTVFEADIMIPSGYDSGSLYQIFFENGEKNVAYMLQLGKVKGGTDITIKDASDASGNTAGRVVGEEYVIGSADEWINLRVELYRGTAEKVKFRLYADGGLVYESTNYYGSHTGGEPYQNVASVRFNSMKDREVVICFDNVSMKQLSEIDE